MLHICNTNMQRSSHQPLRVLLAVSSPPCNTMAVLEVAVSVGVAAVVVMVVVVVVVVVAVVDFAAGGEERALKWLR